jgi:hypothetical protein
MLDTMTATRYANRIVGAAIVGCALTFWTAAGAQRTPTQEANDAIVRRLRADIAGHEQEPAGQVFKNVRFLKDAPASTFLTIMNAGYSTALGVSCSYCHVDGNFASDDKRPKRAAREMQIMHRGFNDQLRTMQNLQRDTERRSISCITCHRGEVSPFRG